MIWWYTCQTHSFISFILLLYISSWCCCCCRCCCFIFSRSIISLNHNSNIHNYMYISILCVPSTLFVIFFLLTNLFDSLSNTYIYMQTYTYAHRNISLHTPRKKVNSRANNNNNTYRPVAEHRVHKNRINFYFWLKHIFLIQMHRFISHSFFFFAYFRYSYRICHSCYHQNG